MRENLSAARAAELLMQKDNITLLCHRRPDGDTVGSAFALYYALKELGKEVRVLCADALPKQYDYLYGDYTPSRVLDWPVEYVVTVDVATAGMLGGLEEKYGHMVDLCIDHHPSNSDYAAQTCLWQGAGGRGGGSEPKVFPKRYHSGPSVDDLAAEIERLRRELGMREANMGGASGRRRALAPRAKNLRTRIYR